MVRYTPYRTTLNNLTSVNAISSDTKLKEDDKSDFDLKDFIPTMDDFLGRTENNSEDVVGGDFKVNNHEFSIREHAWPILRLLTITVLATLAIIWIIGNRFTSNLQNILDNPTSHIKDFINVIISFVFSKVVYIYIPIMSLLYTVAVNYSYQTSNSIKIRENIYFFHIVLFGSEGLLMFLLNFAKMLVIFGVLKVFMDRGVMIRKYIQDNIPNIPNIPGNPLNKTSK